jgi:hypothetical protein
VELVLPEVSTGADAITSMVRSAHPSGRPAKRAVKPRPATNCSMARAACASAVPHRRNVARSGDESPAVLPPDDCVCVEEDDCDCDEEDVDAEDTDDEVEDEDELVPAWVVDWLTWDDDCPGWPAWPSEVTETDSPGCPGCPDC